MTERATLRRDRHTCQFCGQKHCTTVTVLETPTASPFGDKLPLTTCSSCAATHAGATRHTPVYKHLMDQGFTVRAGHPYLMAIVRSIQSPMEAVPQLSSTALQVLKTISALQESIPNHKVRANNRNLDTSDYYRALDELKHHGYIHYNPIEPELITRYDVHATPPITEDLLPLVNHTVTLRRLRLNSPQVDEPALFLARLYTFAGLHVSGTRLRKFLKHNLPTRADFVHAMMLHRLLKYGKIVRTADTTEGGWVFSKNAKAYTDLEFFKLLHNFYQRPWHLIMPSQAELARGEKPRFRRFDEPIPGGTSSSKSSPAATPKLTGAIINTEAAAPTSDQRPPIHH